MAAGRAVFLRRESPNEVLELLRLGEILYCASIVITTQKIGVSVGGLDCGGFAAF